MEKIELIQGGCLEEKEKVCLRCKQLHIHNNSFCSPECCKKYKESGKMSNWDVSKHKKVVLLKLWCDMINEVKKHTKDFDIDKLRTAFDKNAKIKEKDGGWYIKDMTI